MRKIIIVISLLVTFLACSQTKKYIQYTVKDNETITSISKKFGVTPYDILRLNRDAQDGIFIDQILVIPNSAFKEVSTKSSAMVVIEKPKVNTPLKDSIVNGYLYHRVKAGETVYSLSKRYDIKKKKVLKINDLDKKASLSVGQLLKFPTNLPDTKYNQEGNTAQTTEVINEFDGKFIAYEVKAQETLYSIAKNNDLTQEEILALNPSVKENGLREYDVIKLPVRNNESKNEELVVVEELPRDFLYVVPAKETYYNLQRKYNVSKNQLIELNPVLKEGLKEGLEIKIPILENKNILNRKHNFESKTINLALMLPFNADENKDASFEENEVLDASTDIYLGVKLALEDLKKTGLSVNVNVLDTKKSTEVVHELSQTNVIQNADVIIGPLFYKNVKQISKNNLIKVPIISPMSKNNHSELNRNNIIQSTIANKDELFVDVIIDYIKSNYKNENLVLISDDNPETTLKKNNIKKSLLINDSIKQIKEYTLTKGKLKNEELRRVVDKNKKNWILILTKDDIYLDSFVETFGVYNNDYDLTLFSIKKSKNHKRIKSKYLSRVNYHYPVINFTDEKLVKTKEFIDKYVLEYKNYPSDNVLKGYDITYDALVRLALNNDLTSFNENIYEGLNMVFSYKQSFNGIANKAVQVVRYNDFSIEKAK